MKIHQPPMTFKEGGAEFWATSFAANHDEPYGEAIIRYASEWATRAELQLTARGGELNDDEFGKILKETSHQADDEGITGFMYGCAVATLAGCWVHGERLRRWHNIDTQIGTEGDAANEKGTVLNPALLSIGRPEGQDHSP
jgi:hypothetical protein